MPAILTSVSIPLEIYNEVNRLKGQNSRSRFCLKLIELGLKQYKEGSN